LAGMTIRQARSAKQADLTALVSGITGLTAEAISEMIFNHGVQYMEQLGEESITRAFVEEPLYWAWWRQQWALIDEVFTNKVIDQQLTRSALEDLYIRMHKSIDTFPDSTVFNKIHRTYEVMSERVIRNNSNTRQNAIQ